MKKKRYYETGAVFEFKKCTYILSQVDCCIFNLISLEDGSNRWTKSVSGKPGRPTISDNTIRRLVGRNHNTDKLYDYKYLGQFNEVFEQMGR